MTLTTKALKARLEQLEREQEELLARANAASGAAALCRELLDAIESGDKPPTES